MLVLREYRDANEDPGVWREVNNEENLKLPVAERARLLIRGIPEDQEKIFNRKYDEDLSLNVKRQEVKIAAGSGGDKLLARCVFALKDVENIGVLIGDAKTLAVYKGHFPEAQVGDIIDMAGKLGNEDLRRTFLMANTALLTDIFEGIQGLRVHKKAIEEQAAKN